MTLQGRVWAAQALQQAGLSASAGPLERASSITNEVWYAGPWVVRVNVRPRRGTLKHEAEIAHLLPESVGYPDVVAYGSHESAEWLVHRRVEGSVLSRVWPSLRETERRSATVQLADRLRAIHDISGAPIPAYLLDDNLECPHQLPASRAVELLLRVSDLPHVDHGVVHEAIALIETNADYLDEGAGAALIHGDLHFENVLWDGESISAVLDLEWARPAAPDIDLDVLLRFCQHPFLHVAEDYATQAKADDYRLAPKWFHDSYPELFEHPHLAERLAIYSLAYDVRTLLLMPPDRPMEHLPTYHPMRRIAATVRQQGYLRGIHI
jgi:aminoglycoside phosphotransferase (APT) family kinase protein